MKLSLATKMILLTQLVFLTAAVCIVLLVTSHFRSVIDTSHRQIYDEQIAIVLNTLERRAATVRDRQGNGLEAAQEEVLRDLRAIYYHQTDLSAHLVILDRQGTILLHPRLPAGDNSLRPRFAGMVGDMQHGKITMTEHGEQHYLYYSPFSEWQWLVGWAVPEEIHSSEAEELRTSLIFIFIGAFCFLVPALALFAAWVLRPIRGVTRAANAITAGREPQQVPVRRKDEIGELARAFMKMQGVIKENLARLGKSEKKYRELVQYANSIILRWDREGRVTYLNSYGQRLFGYRSGEIVGRHVVGSIVAPTESDSGRDLTAMIDDILQRPENYALNENENICRDGTTVWIQWSNNPIFDDAGRFVEMLSVGIDITDRKQAERDLRESENRYRSLFEFANDAILICDGQGACIACNQMAVHLFGDSRRQLIGKSPRDFAPETQPEGGDSSAIMDGAVAGAMGGTPQKFEWQLRRLDGELRDVRCSITSFEANGEKYLQLVMNDLTRQKRMEIELRQAQKMEGIGTLAGGIAHDFNNILSAIIGYTELAQMKVSQDSDLAMDLGQVRKASERARGLVRQILTFSRKQKYEPSVLQVSLIVKEALKLIRSSIPTTIEIDQDITTRAAVLTDPTQIHQLIMNLCTNAYQAMPEGGRLTVAMHETRLSGKSGKAVDLPGGSYVEIKVSDTGCGMDKETVARIFDPFFTTKEMGRGTGLGLAVVHDIVTSLGGAVTVESTPGSGTSFSVYLPVAGEQRPSPEPSPDTGYQASSNERIMVVDDEQAIRDLMRAILSSSGYEVDLFADGEAAWSAFSAQPDKWKLIITDQTMPRMTGSQLAVRAMETRPRLPVILCTGYSESISMEEARNLGIRAYLHKPLSMNELLAAVHQALDR